MELPDFNNDFDDPVYEKQPNLLYKKKFKQNQNIVKKKNKGNKGDQPDQIK